jgi:hypothetical protein
MQTGFKNSFSIQSMESNVLYINIGVWKTKGTKVNLNKNINDSKGNFLVEKHEK